MNTTVATAATPPTKPEKQETVRVEKRGDKIIIPEGMPYKDARDWLTRQEQAEEAQVNIHHELKCFPLDGIVALLRAIEEIYGFAELGGIQTWFGERPPVMIQIETPKGMVSAPIGCIRPPKWEGGQLDMKIMGPALTIAGTVKRKFEPDVQRVIAETKKQLERNSIYRGQAITMDLCWYDDPSEFHPIEHAPKFMDLGNCELVMNAETEFELGTSVLMLIERTEACRANKIPLKHGALFKGPYGTGKTMAAKFIAKKCKDNGWTFIYLKDASQVANGLRIAKLYAPAVVFAEDVDTVTDNRDEKMNELLNTLDGVDTKDAPIITVLTTNHVEEIDPSFLRAGRIDTVIHFGEPDARAAAKFATRFAGQNLSGDVDLDAVGKAFEGLVPAFIREAVHKAMSYAMYRTGNPDITGQVTTDDLLKAATVLRKQVELMKPKESTPEEKLAKALAFVNGIGDGDIADIAANTVDE